MSTDLDQQRLLDVIAFQADMAGGGEDPARTMQLACERAQTLTHADGAVVELSDGDEMVYTTVSGTLSGQEQLRLPAASSLSGLAIRSGQVLQCDDSETDPRANREACRKVGLRSMVCVPLSAGGSTVGVLKVVSPRTKAFGDTDIAVLRLVGGVIASAIRQAALLQQLRDLAARDPLTGLPNRRSWDETLARALAHASRHGRSIGVCVLDLDGFKQVNDAHGHAAGDELLRHAAAAWSSVVREDEMLARIGGDEFAVLLVGVHHASCSDIAERLRRAYAPHGSVSAGIAIAVLGDDVASLMRKADRAMYADKARHRTAGPQPAASALR
jgi:diguanylate cyclase (GGDEF)-like protein